MKNKAAVTAAQKDKLAKPKAKPQTAAQKKKVETYKSTQKSLNENKYGYGLGRPGLFSGPKQEKAAMARNASKRKAITGKASDYQQSRGKKK
jgi:hypothetical protein